MPRSRPARASLLIFVLALTSCSESPRQQAAPPPPPAVTVEKPVKRAVIDRDEYVGRFVAIDSVEIRARVSGYLSRNRLYRRPDGQEGRPAVHAGQAPVPGRPRPGGGQPRAGPRQPGLCRDRPQSRRPAGARSHHHGADLRSAHPGQAGRRSDGAGARGRRRHRQARSRIHRTAGAGGGPHRRPARSRWAIS